MSKRSHLRALIASQIVCTLLGLWVQQRYLTCEVERTLEERSPALTAIDRTSVVGAVESAFRGTSILTFFWTNGLLGVATYLIVTRLHDDMSRRSAVPAADALRKTTDLIRTQDAVIFGLAKLAESRDLGTGEHLERIALYSSTLASALLRRGLHPEIVTPAFVQHIGTSSALHDIGKVAIRDDVLRKRGALTASERREMQEHARIGAECLQDIERRLGTSNFLRMAREIALAHHERWDGGGYPAGRAGPEIPLAARIVAIADVYDALRTNRVYKASLCHAECVDFIRNAAGRQFDPQLVDVFLEIEQVFDRLSRRFSAADDLPPDEILQALNQAPSPDASPAAEAFHSKQVVPCGDL